MSHFKHACYALLACLYKLLCCGCTSPQLACYASVATLACCTGSLRELTLTGLPRLQHLRVTQQLPNSVPKVTVQCKALRLPHSLLSFHLTTSGLDIKKHLSSLVTLPLLDTFGLHGPLHEQIPTLPTTLTWYILCCCSPLLSLHTA